MLAPTFEYNAHYFFIEQNKSLASCSSLGSAYAHSSHVHILITYSFAHSKSCASTLCGSK